MEKLSTKQCWNCGNQYLVCLSSLNKKLCNDCGAEMPWDLEENQPSLFGDRIGVSEND